MAILVAEWKHLTVSVDMAMSLCQWGGGGGVERDQISDIRPPKKIKYQISHP